jgi:hypothetical protein
MDVTPEISYKLPLHIFSIARLFAPELLLLKFGWIDAFSRFIR